MKILNLIWLTGVELVKQVCLLPKTLAAAAVAKRGRAAAKEHNAERLDRIRNPLKYLGK
jgi:hypothetical protein